MITLDPPLADQHEATDESGGYTSEPKAILQRANTFAKMVNSEYGHASVIVPTLSGERVLVSRFVCPQRTPHEVTTILEAARFVSLVPFMEDWQLFVGNDDMWSTSSQFLELCAGDWEEHAILLRNYFSFIDQSSGAANESYIVFGHGIPEGDTCYVLRKPRNEAQDGVTLWNSATGVEYSASDPRCPLQTISMVVGEQNMYMNSQKSGMPSRIFFDFENAKNWKPFFNAKFPKPDDYRHCQPEINYTETPEKEVEGLERQIMETLKIDLKEWRSKSYQTYLNQSVARDLRKTLESLEAMKRGVSNYSEDSHLDGLRKWTNSYDVNGYPLNFTFTDVKAISYAVKDTGIHMNEDPNVKFAITVKCFGYPCGVVSVWVYVAALVRKR